MIVTTRSDDLPAADRFDWFCEQVAREMAPAVVSSPHAGNFPAVVTLADLGPVRLSVMMFPEARAVRTPALVRRSDPARYGISLMTENALCFSRRDRDTQAGPGDLVFHDTSRPYDARTVPGAGLAKMLTLHFPKAALPVRPERQECLLRAGAGMNAILAGYLMSVASALEQGEVSEPETERLGKVALELAVAVLAAQVGAQDRLTPETRRQALLSRIEAFIEHNLGDPGLTPAAIAVHHHVSLGYLHRLFQSRELTVAAWIRHLRLERCRADLANPRLRGQPVTKRSSRRLPRYRMS